jgi:hypothetical protein
MTSPATAATVTCRTVALNSVCAAFAAGLCALQALQVALQVEPELVAVLP